MTENSNFRVFVGSTYRDLKSYRAAVRDCLQRFEVIVRGMEAFGSRPNSPVEECLRLVQSCKIYIGIFGMRYGTVPDGGTKSMTHLEYDEAQFYRIPSLIYIIDEERQPVLPKHVDFGPEAERLRELKARLCEKHTISFFTTEEDLASKIAHDLPRLLGDISGWKAHEPDNESPRRESSVEYIENREKANLRSAFSSARKEIKIIQTNLSTVVSEYSNAIETALKMARNNNRNLEVSLLSLDPDSNFTSARAKQLGMDVYKFRNELHTALRTLRERFRKYKNVEIRIYDDFPTQICFIVDSIIYNCTVTKHQQSRHNCLFKFDSKHPALFTSFVSHFNSVWIDKNTTRDYLPDDEHDEQLDQGSREPLIYEYNDFG